MLRARLQLHLPQPLPEHLSHTLCKGQVGSRPGTLGKTQGRPFQGSLQGAVGPVTTQLLSLLQPQMRTRTPVPCLGMLFFFTLEVTFDSNCVRHQWVTLFFSVRGWGLLCRPRVLCTCPGRQKQSVHTLSRVSIPPLHPRQPDGGSVTGSRSKSSPSGDDDGDVTFLSFCILLWAALPTQSPR